MVERDGTDQDWKKVAQGILRAGPGRCEGKDSTPRVRLCNYARPSNIEDVGYHSDQGLGYNENIKRPPITKAELRL